MVRALSVLFVLLCTACGLAEDDRDEDNKYIYLDFYDKAFEAYCLEKFDTNGDGRISRYEAQRVRRMSCPGRGIASLTDIREFFNLRELDCSGNDLTRLDLTACTYLERLDCRGNALTTLDVASCDANLKADVRSNPGLTTVYCLVSQNISFDGPTELTRL